MNPTAILQSPSYCKKQLVGDNLRTKPKKILVSKIILLKLAETKFREKIKKPVAR